jgi:hypothetical protein
MKPKAVCCAAAAVLGLAALATAPAWSQSLIGHGIAAEQDPYASSYRARHAEVSTGTLPPIAARGGSAVSDSHSRRWCR